MKNKPLLDESYWKFIEEIAEQVDGWPAWKRGAAANQPSNREERQRSDVRHSPKSAPGEVANKKKISG